MVWGFHHICAEKFLKLTGLGKKRYGERVDSLAINEALETGAQT